jgi:hypothetical protein
MAALGAAEAEALGAAEAAAVADEAMDDAVEEDFDRVGCRIWVGTRGRTRTSIGHC